MSAILDMITGGGFLPHVYCKNIVLENHPEDSSDVNVTLHFELYQSAAGLSESNWLNNFNILGANIYDSMMIEVIPFRNADNIKKLLASNNPMPTQNMTYADVGSVYVAKQQVGDGYIPRSSLGSGASAGGVGEGISLASQTIFPVQDDFTFGDDSEFHSPPLRMNNSNILQNLSGKASYIDNPMGQGWSMQDLSVGQARQEIKNGKPYYVIPFQQTFRHNLQQDPNLGFLFYSMLHIPDFFNATGAFDDINFDFGDLLEAMIIEGPMNTEIVFKDGAPTKTREVFTLPNGKIWEGSVHLHAQGFNPAPDGYAGDGGFGENRGWMVGERHMSGVNQHRLSLNKMPNALIQDFRVDLSTQPYDGFMGFGVESPLFSLNEDAEDAVKLFLSPFQKESRKYLSKFGDRRSAGLEAQYNAVGTSYYDNDAEFSKLYLTRDRRSNARGMFFIDIQQFLRSNSKLYPILFDKTLGNDAPGSAKTLLEESRLQVVNNSKILEIKMFRDRVNKRSTTSTRERYANDTEYEEPSYLIGTISDGAGYQTPNQTNGLVELVMGGDFNPFKQRFFTFSDLDVGEKTAGVYQYRIEITFQDGTYAFLQDLLRETNSIKIMLDEYYETAMEYYIDPLTDKLIGGDPSKKSLLLGQGDLKQSLRPYFDSKSNKFIDQFANYIIGHPRLSALAGDNTEFKTITDLLGKYKIIFGLYNLPDGAFSPYTVVSLISPQDGTPNGIDFVRKFFQSAIAKLESLLDLTKLSKTGNELANSAKTDGYNFNNFSDYDVSPTDVFINDSHVFNNVFETTGNENIYAEYLNIGTDFVNNNHFADYGLRRIYVNTYKERCKLEVAKIHNGYDTSTFSNFDELWNRDMNHPQAPSELKNLQLGKFSDSGYSYLSPSLIELSDSIQRYDPDKLQKRSYSYFYNVFSGIANKYFTSGEASDIFSNTYLDYESHELLLLALLSYNLNKKDISVADLTDAFSIGPTQYDVAGTNVTPKQIETREAYKNLTERYGISVLSLTNYEKFYGDTFSKRPGATFPDIADHEEYHQPFVGGGTKKGLWLKDDYADGNMLSQNFLRKLIFDSSQDMIERPSLPNLPLLFSGADNSKIPPYQKMYHISKIDDSSIREDMVAAISAWRSYKNNESSWSSRLSSLFFYAGMTVRVDVLKAYPEFPTGYVVPIGQQIAGYNLAKDDEYMWGPLTAEDLDNMQEEQKLFCRMSLTEDAQNLGISAPILDRYFIIDGKPTGSGATMDYGVWEIDLPAPVYEEYIPEPPAESEDVVGDESVWVAQQGGDIGGDDSTWASMGFPLPGGVDAAIATGANIEEVFDQMMQLTEYKYGPDYGPDGPMEDKFASNGLQKNKMFNEGTTAVSSAGEKTDASGKPANNPGNIMISGDPGTNLGTMTAAAETTTGGESSQMGAGAAGTQTDLQTGAAGLQQEIGNLYD